MKNKTFWQKLKEYFLIYLPKQRNSSEKTLDTYKNAWNLLLRYMINDCKISPSDINYGSFSKEVINSFLDSLEKNRSWKPTTRNNRLNCIRSFFKYAGSNCPEAYVVYTDLRTIPEKKGINKSHVVDYMSEDAVAAIINGIDCNSKQGLRDRFFITLMYDTAARDGEMLQLKLSDINMDNSTIYLLGKGSKIRIVPLSKKTLDMFGEYKKVYHEYSTQNELLFYTIHKREKTAMSDDNVARFLSSHASMARKTNKNVPAKVHPHMIRHSRAMHLYRNGMPLSVLSEFLGHENPETTLIYAYADTEMKREAILKATSKHVFDEKEAEIPIWDKKSDIIDRLIRGF